MIQTSQYASITDTFKAHVKKFKMLQRKQTNAKTLTQILTYRRTE